MALTLPLSHPTGPLEVSEFLGVLGLTGLKSWCWATSYADARRMSNVVVSLNAFGFSFLSTMRSAVIGMPVLSFGPHCTCVCGVTSFGSALS